MTHINEKIERLKRTYETADEVKLSSTSIFGPFLINNPLDYQFIERNGINIIQLQTGQKALYYRTGKAEKLLEEGSCLILGLGTYWGSVRVVDTRLQTVDFPVIKTYSADGIEVAVDSAINFAVIDPWTALTGAENHLETLKKVSEGIVKRAIGVYNVGKVIKQSVEERREPFLDILGINVAPNPAEENYDKNYPFKRIGVSLEQVIIEQISYPSELRAQLAKITLAYVEAGEIQIRTEANRLAAEVYKQNPIMLELRKIQAIEEMARSGKSTFYDAAHLFAATREKTREPPTTPAG